MDDNLQRPLKNLKGFGVHYWEAAKRGELLYQWCHSCSLAFFPARIACPQCLQSATVEWKKSPGTGTVYSYTVIYRSRQPYFASKVPYVVALIDVDPGFRVMSNIEGIEPTQVTVGMPVVVRFENVSEQYAVPIFEPSSGGDINE